MHVISFQPNSNEYRRLFDSFPLELYKDEVYVDYNPFFMTNSIAKTELFLVLDGEKVLGRLAVMVDPQFSYNREEVGIWGFFESIESIGVTESLMKAANTWLKKQGCSYSIGPINCSLWFTHSFSEKINDPFFTDRFNKEYYTNLFTMLDYREVMTSSSTYLSMKSVHADSRFTDAKKRFEDTGIIITECSAQDVENDLPRIHSFLMETFSSEPLYTPISFLECKAMAGKVIPYLDKNFVLMAQVEGEIVGFALAYPDLFCKNEKRIVLQIIAVKRSRLYAGLGVYLTKQIHYRAKALDYDAIIHAHMNDSAGVKNILDEEARVIQRYVLYGKEL